MQAEPQTSAVRLIQVGREYWRLAPDLITRHKTEKVAGISHAYSKPIQLDISHLLS
jgi:hypothetical protein